jgi:copper oxidase (laccase) domain-containing protein
MTRFPKNIICETSTVAHRNMSFRAGANQEVVENRTAFLAQFGIAYKEHIAMSCDHGEIITLVDETHESVGATDPEQILQSEVLVTQKKHLALFLLTADCQPMSFYDPVTQTIALAHISRKTIVQKLIQKTVQFLQSELGVEPTNLLIHIDPHIKKESYVFPLPLSEDTPELKECIEEKDGNAFIDLIKASLQQLNQAGLNHYALKVHRLAVD